MSVIEIKDRDDLRVGDIATFACEGHEFTGPLWAEGGRTLFLGATLIRYVDGHWAPHEFVRATREAPSLPTEPGAVIYVTEVRGERADEPVLAVCDGDGSWRTFGHMFDGCILHRHEYISAWSPAKVVPA